MKSKKSILRKYSYTWVTAFLFGFSLIGHWLFGWYSYVNEQHQHGQPIEVMGYTHEMLRDTFENWQSEFLQLIWQVAGLAYLLHVGSPTSKEGDDRVEAKIDALLYTVNPNAKAVIAKIDEDYLGRHTDPYFPRKPPT